MRSAVVLALSLACCASPALAQGLRHDEDGRPLTPPAPAPPAPEDVERVELWTERGVPRRGAEAPSPHALKAARDAALEAHATAVGRSNGGLLAAQRLARAESARLQAELDALLALPPSAWRDWWLGRTRAALRLANDARARLDRRQAEAAADVVLRRAAFIEASSRWVDRLLRSAERARGLAQPRAAEAAALERDAVRELGLLEDMEAMAAAEPPAAGIEVEPVELGLLSDEDLAARELLVADLVRDEQARERALAPALGLVADRVRQLERLLDAGLGGPAVTERLPAARAERERLEARARAHRAAVEARRRDLRAVEAEAERRAPRGGGGRDQG